jgi:2-polyprenyl-3-methyl-5-hydroxy-6-metoxy-1,4-benzoquinol methylase
MGLRPSSIFEIQDLLASEAREEMSEGTMARGEAVICPNCGHSCSALLRARDLNRGISEEQFAYYHCAACGLVHQSPVPANLNAYYTMDYPQYAFPQSLDELKQRSADTSSRVSFVQQFVRSGKLLEVGAGYGAFSYMAQERGFEVEAVEMSLACCQYMEKIGLRALCSSSFSSLDNLIGSFDAIVLWHVLEHLESYKEAMAVLARHLAPGGVLVICSPNPASLQFRLFGRFWVSLDAPRHLSFVPLSVLAACAMKCGLETAFASTSDLEALQYNKWCWEASLSHLMVNTKLMPKLGVRAILRRRNSGIGRYFSAAHRLAGKSITVGLARTLNFAFAPLEKSGCRGTSYSIVFRKPMVASQSAGGRPV